MSVVVVVVAAVAVAVVEGSGLHSLLINTTVSLRFALLT